MGILTVHKLSVRMIEQHTGKISSVNFVIVGPGFRASSLHTVANAVTL